MHINLAVKQQHPYASLTRAYKAILSLVGLAVYRAAESTRRIIFAHVAADPKKIGVLCDSFLRYGVSQAIGLQQTGLNVTLYHVDRLNDFATSEEDRALLLDHARVAGIEVVRVPPRRLRSLLTNTLWLHRDLLHRKIATIVVQAHADPRYATLGFRLPVALILHDPQEHSGDMVSRFPLPMRAAARLAELTSACLIIHSSRLSAQIRPLLRSVPVGIVPHGAEMASVPSAVPPERRLLIFGRLFAYKGVDTSLEAMRLLPREMSDVKLIVAGQGPLAELARGRPDVELRDEYIADSDVDFLLNEVRLVLLPYKDATQSGVGVQAVARGVPCVVSSAGGLPDLIQDTSSGLVVPPDDPKQLAQAVVAHIDHPAALRTAIYDHASTHFAWPVVAQRLRSELHRLGLSGRGSPPGVAP